MLTTYFPQTCSWLTHIDDALFIVNYLAVAAFTSLRVYAISDKDLRPLILVVPLSLGNPIILMVRLEC